MTEKELDKLIRVRKTPNVPDLHRSTLYETSKTTGPACPELRRLCQGVINGIPDHAHLRFAQIGLLVEYSDATAKKIKKRDRITAGTARRISGLVRMLTSNTDAPKLDDTPRPAGVDFIVTISGDWLTSIGFEEGCGDVDVYRPILALIDHELMHCGIKIGGKFVAEKDVEKYVGALGDRHIETCMQVRDDDGKVLVRFEMWDDEKHPVFILRKHDIEEFCSVVARWGKYHPAVGELVDVLVTDDGKERA